MSIEIRDAYSPRAAEYSKSFGSMATVHPSDRQLVSTWADQITGQVIDAGCGPGHWTRYLATRGVDARGVDLVPEFIAHASAINQGITFYVGSIDALDASTGTVGGVLSWYSLIHYEPSAIQEPLAEFARVLSPGGGLLLGFFEGSTVERFEHAIVAAYRWPVGELSDELRAAGFDIIETHARTGPGYRPHGAIVARRTADR